ncbi:uncharacterized protein BYT42DRAFT_584381 [Radiomyces spectabilis]|uniref:uncharacterized protein n=1 Tax=Radiomyces spectabilis TaxID=64574 RepID=UPI0022211C7A|nr:uncharacterized protein BYT42DRAFT_584381 [Radiomyces spectabilis]KAI8369419.1 hypothetical protein BYT42DRAFT_584381 [Radiomyces spectabilis]
MSDNLNTLGQRFQSLRAEHDSEEKKNVMMALADQLGLPGTPAADILSRFGKPDELTPQLEGDNQAFVATMPGIALGEGGVSTNASGPEKAYYLVYYNKPQVDYLYFKIDPVKETVITSEWKNK